MPPWRSSGSPARPPRRRAATRSATPAPSPRPPAGPEARAAVQAGLRVAFGEDARDLSDGVIGPVTLSFLGQLCAQVPLAAGTDPVAGTLDLAREYAALSREADDWTARIADPALLAAATATFNRDVLRLAGPPQTSAQALAGTSDPADCAALATAELPADPAGLVRLQAGLAALLDADPNLTPLGDAPETRAALAQVCAAYPAGGTAALVAEVQRLGDIAAAVPDALPTLASPQFARWLEASQAVRLGRLLGTVPAVVRLLQDYLAEAGPVTIAEVPGCEPPMRRRYRPGSRSTPPTSRSSRRAPPSTPRSRRSPPSASPTATRWSRR